MLLSKEVEVVLASPVIGHYERLGYEIPRRPNRDGILTTPRGTKLTVKTEDLPLLSDVVVRVRCDYCGSEIDKQYKKYLKERKIIEKDACSRCCSLKQRDVLIKTYGVTHQTQIPSVLERMSKNRRKYNINDIEEEFKERGYEILESEYINTDNKLNYICLKHKNKGVQSITYSNFKKGQGCWHCGNEKIGDALRYEYEFVKDIFNKNNCTLISKEYVNCKLPLEFFCNKHNHLIQTTTLDNFNVVGCIYCNKENKILANEYAKELQTYAYLRTTIRDWQQCSMMSSNYRCVITNEPFDDIHHLYSFRSILNEVLEELKLKWHQLVSGYSKDELVNIVNLLQLKHVEHGDGVCLKRNIHEAFHKNFGYQNNTPEQFEEFKICLKNGEFNDFLEENNLELII